MARTGETIALSDADDVRDGRSSAFDAPIDDGTRSVLAVPLQEPAGDVVGVLQLINARDEDGTVIPFAAAFEGLVRSLAAQAAVAIRNATLEDLSFKDPLTGAYNRRYFMLRIEEEAKRHTRYGEPVSLVLIDVDHFKPVNDRHGHSTGDTVLREVTHVLMENSRDFSIVTRYGGDEFAVLLVKHAEGGRPAVCRADPRHRRASPIRPRPPHPDMGVATLPDDVRAADELIPASDRALYAAKQAGRNTIQGV
jgi:diguanylate cyclase (GGDEF)-like protein